MDGALLCVWCVCPSWCDVRWHRARCVLRRPDDTVWEGGTFNLIIKFSEEYPNIAPKVRFVTKMFHPNSA